MVEKVDTDVLVERIEQIKERIYQRLDLEDEAFRQFKRDLDARLEQMNELRTQILSERALFVTWWSLLSVTAGAVTIAVGVATLIIKLTMGK